MANYVKPHKITITHDLVNNKTKQIFHMDRHGKVYRSTPLYYDEIGIAEEFLIEVENFCITNDWKRIRL